MARKKELEIVEKESKAVVTTLLGSFRCSIPYYLSKVLTDLNLKVIVIDNTVKNETFTILRKSPSDEVLKRKNTYYVKNRIVDKETLATLDKSFDHVIVLCGNEESSYSKELFDRTDHFVMVTGYDRFSRDEFKEAMSRIFEMDSAYLSDKGRTISMVWNEKVPCKIIEKDFESRCNLSVTQRSSIRSCDTNRRNYLSLTESGDGKIKSLSQDYKEFLSKTANLLTDNSHVRAVKKLCK